MTYQLGPAGSGFVFRFASTEEMGELVKHEDGDQEILEEVPAVERISIAEALRDPAFHEQFPHTNGA